MFRNKHKIVISFIINGLLGLPWAFLAVIFAIYGLLLFFNQVDDATDYDRKMFFVMMALALFCVWVFGKRCLRAFQAHKLGKFFENYEDGLVSIEAAAGYMKLKQKKFFAVFMDCLGRNLLVNCGIFADDPTHILLENGGKTLKQKFAVVHCSNCGAPSVYRIGFDNVCKYCDSVILFNQEK